MITLHTIPLTVSEKMAPKL